MEQALESAEARRNFAAAAPTCSASAAAAQASKDRGRDKPKFLPESQLQQPCLRPNGCEVSFMFAIFFILLIMWALGMISSYTFGGAIHLLLVFALIVLVIRLVQGRSVA